MTPEFSRPFAAKNAGLANPVHIAAREEECAPVAHRLMIPSLEALECDWILEPLGDGVVAAHGELLARLHYECVVTLEPFAASVREVFDVRFVPIGAETESDDPAAPDELPYDGTMLDLGEAAVEQLALSLDPYPHAPGATLAQDGEAPGDGAFGALARWRKEE